MIVSRPNVHDHRASHEQRGAIALIVAAALATLGALLMTVQMGYDYLQEQRLQKAADLAALSAVQTLDETTCDRASLARITTSIAQQNARGISVADVTCGRWAGRPTPAFTANPVTAPDRPLNAIRVRLTIPMFSFLPNIFGGNSQTSSDRSLSAVSTAVVGPPLATFSVGSRLLSLEPGSLVSSILTSPGTQPVDLQVLDSDGLAHTTVTPGRLLKALDLPATALVGLGSPDNGAVSLEDLALGTFLSVIDTKIVSPGSAAQTSVHLLRNLVAAADLDGANLNLAGDHGIFAHVSNENLSSALNAQISLADLLGASILLANGTNLIRLDSTSLAGANSLQARIITPPTLVIGGRVGTAATNSQVRLSLNISTEQAFQIPLIGELPILGGLANKVIGNTLSTMLPVNLPITLESASSTGRLDALSTSRQEAEFSTRSSAATLCLGNLPAGQPCSSSADAGTLTAARIIDVAGLITVQAKAEIPLVTGSDWVGPTPVRVGETKTVSTGSRQKDIRRGDLSFQANLIGINSSFLNTVLDAVTAGLNQAVTSVLQQVLKPLLGVDYNQTDIHLYSIARGAPYLVQ